MSKRFRGSLASLLVIGVLLALTAAVAHAASQASAPTNSAKPTITDSNFQVGDTLTATTGTWTDSPTSYTYRWERCDAQGANCQTIAGQTGTTYTLTSSDVDHTIVVEVTATNASGSAAASSDPTPVVASTSDPVNTDRPSISGTPAIGQTLTAANGSWTGGVRSYSYQWQSCNSGGQQCTSISGATGQTYNVAPSDAGHTLRVQVTATNPSGSTSATSDRTDAVASPVQPAACGTTADKVTTLSDGSKSVGVADVNLPDRLIVDKLFYTPKSITRKGQLIVAHFHVAETVGSCSVSGAMVYALGVPFNVLTSQGEKATGADGWVTVSFQVRSQASSRLHYGDYVVLFVRARKPGDNVLAGVSTRRLVSIRYFVRH